MTKKNSDATKQWTQLCQELEEAKAAYEAAETSIACPGEPSPKTQEALKASLEASKRVTEILEKMRKITAQRE